MTSLDNLHGTLQTLSSLLDQAAGHIRDRSQRPTPAQIELVSQLLVAICGIQTAIYKENLDPTAMPDDTSTAIRRLGDLLILAESLVAGGRPKESMTVLDEFIAHETSDFHREIAMVQKRKLFGGV